MKNLIVSNHLVRASNFLLRRNLSAGVVFESYGAPAKVLRYVDSIPSINELKPNEVALKILAAPINPADINLIEGVYGISAKFPAVGGQEGVGEITKIGSTVKNLSVGDWVIPSSGANGFGTWRQQAVADGSLLQKIPKDIPLPYAATLNVNPCTAYRMLHDFVTLKPGDVIMQNAANSMVGLAVIQIARELGLKTINIIRSDRPDAQEMLRLLHEYGGDVNIPDIYVNTPNFQEILADLPPCKLALNAVGGPLLTNMARSLPNGATIVTYGGMSKAPVTIPYEILTYKQLNLHGFWVSQWHKTHSQQEKDKMISDLCEFIRTKKLSFLFEVHDFDDFHYALEKAQEPYRLRKVVLNMNPPDRLKEHDSRPESDYSVFETTVV